MSEKFDPNRHLRVLKGKGGSADYLDVKWRLVWLRSEHPDAVSGVEHVEISPDVAIFKATVSIPGGGTAIDYGSETPRDFGDYIEKAATKALGRALAQLGYGTQFVGFELDENTRIVDSPVYRDDDGVAASRPARSGRVASPQPPGGLETFALARPTPPGATKAPAQDETPAQAGARPYSAAEGEGPANWTTIWREAKAQGIHDQPAMAKFLGVANPATMDPATILARLRDQPVRPAGFAG